MASQPNNTERTAKRADAQSIRVGAFLAVGRHERNQHRGVSQRLRVVRSYAAYYVSTVLETQRLRLRQMVPSDIEALAQIFSDPEAMKHYPAAFTRNEVMVWIERQLRNYAEPGYGLWARELKETGDVIGDCGLTWQRVGYSPERQLENRMACPADLWNRGLATEAASACRDYARDVLGQKHLIAIITAANLPSQAVARKLGMAMEREDLLDSRRRLIFGIDLR